AGRVCHQRHQPERRQPRLTNNFVFVSSRRRHTSSKRDWSSDVCSSDLATGDAMDFAPDEEMRRAIDAAAEIAAQIAPDYPQREQRGCIEPELRELMGSRGLIAPELPHELGGRGERALTTGMITEQIARGDMTVAYVQVIGSLVGQILARTARAEVAARWAPRITSGQDLVAIGLSEPGNGSDAGNPSMTAREADDGWVLEGT